MLDESIVRIIDKTIKEIWVNEIKNDYEGDYLLKEDSLKNSMYFHLRTKLDTILKKYNLRIFPEYSFPELKCRADLVIVQMDTESENYYLKERVKNIIAIFELKYVNVSTNDRATEQWILNDIRKFKRYIQKGKMDAQFYFAVIYENERASSTWMDKRSSNNWAKGKVTELNALWVSDEMKFEVNSYNELNKD